MIAILKQKIYLDSVQNTLQKIVQNVLEDIKKKSIKVEKVSKVEKVLLKKYQKLENLGVDRH